MSSQRPPRNTAPGTVAGNAQGGARLRRWRETFATVCVVAAPCLVVVLGSWMLLDVLRRGLPGLSLTFLVAPVRDAGRAGGIGPVLVSTGLILLVCLAAIVPIGLGAAAHLAACTSSASRWRVLVRRSLDLLAGVPSIVLGLFGSAFFCVFLGLGFSILSGGLTLACMALPLFVRAVEDSLRAVPEDIHLSAAALGLGPRRTFFSLVLPVAAPGLLAGLVLSVGRALAETAALLFTAGYVARLPRSLFDSGRALSVHVYDLAANVAGGEPNAWTSAVVLLGAIVAIEGVTALLTHRLIAARVTRP
jgi:phosphate transport system permease protein